MAMTFTEFRRLYYTFENRIICKTGVSGSIKCIIMSENLFDSLISSDDFPALRFFIEGQARSPGRMIYGIPLHLVKDENNILEFTVDINKII